MGHHLGRIRRSSYLLFSYSTSDLRKCASTYVEWSFESMRVAGSILSPAMLNAMAFFFVSRLLFSCCWLLLSSSSALRHAWLSLKSKYNFLSHWPLCSHPLSLSLHCTTTTIVINIVVTGATRAPPFSLQNVHPFMQFQLFNLAWFVVDSFERFKLG